MTRGTTSLLCALPHRPPIAYLQRTKAPGVQQQHKHSNGQHGFQSERHKLTQPFHGPLIHSTGDCDSGLPSREAKAQRVARRTHLPGNVQLSSCVPMLPGGDTGRSVRRLFKGLGQPEQGQGHDPTRQRTLQWRHMACLLQSTATMARTIKNTGTKKTAGEGAVVRWCSGGRA